MDDEWAIPDGTGVYIVLGAMCLTLLLRTSGESFPTGLDIVVALLFGGLALASVKLASYAVREYLLDIIFHSGEAPARNQGGATQTTTIHPRSDRPGPDVKTSPPNGNSNGEFLQYGNKQVRLSPAEFGELEGAIALSRESLGEKARINNRDLYLKLKGLGLVDNDMWTPAGVIRFNIPVEDGERASEDYDFVPGPDGTYEHNLHDA